MAAFIQHLSTIVPQFAYRQSDARDIVKEWSTVARTRRIIHSIYDRSGIETRYSVCGDFEPGREATLYKNGPQGIPVSPGTGERNAVYAEESRDLAVQLAKKVFAETSHFKKEEVTHIVFASCTGFANPGPDYHIIRSLGLPGHVQRYTLGFMGCYAAFPALRMAAQFCEADPKAVVLVICLELCSLHLQINDQPDCILANSLFADGAAAALVSARPPAPDQPAYRVHEFTSSLVTSGEQDMAWDIGNHGFNIVLSSYVPDVIGSNIRAMVESSLGQKNLSLSDVQEWAVHPGGRAILDRVQDSLGLGPEVLTASRRILRDYGNMSSATVMFVLKELLETAETESAMTGAMAFGPGLTVETALFQRINGPASSATRAFDHATGPEAALEPAAV